jgi:phage gp36-like protein
MMRVSLFLRRLRKSRHLQGHLAPLVDQVALATLDDANLHLPNDKVVVDTAEFDETQLDAERIIRGYLATYYPATTMSLWLDPDSTPGLIRSITGRLIAAFVYRKRYSEDSLDDPEYAQNKYNEAISLLQGIQNGSIVVEGVEEPTTDRLTSADFWPNHNTLPDNFFKMSDPY